jgi:mRNA interferase MazF
MCVSETPVKRGEIWIGNLNPSRASEAGKIRPVLILEADWLSALEGSTVIVLPLTTQVQADRQALRPILQPRAGLRQISQILVDKPRTLDRRRLASEPVASLTKEEMGLVDRSLGHVLGLRPL